MTSSNKMHYVEIILESGDPEELRLKIMEQYPDIYQNFKFGDFIENGTESGYRCNGVYIVNKNQNNELFLDYLSSFPDDYGTLPENFEAFTYFDPGYHFEMERYEHCKSNMHNNLIPINIDFLESLEWNIKEFNRLETIWIHNNRKYLLITYQKTSKFRINNVVYASIFLKKTNSFDQYEIATIEDHFTDQDKEKYKDFDKIIII